jgi:hypothetical protein
VADIEQIERFKTGLKIGSMISARVTQELGQDQYLVSLRGMNLVAESDIPLKKGDRFKAKIEALKPKLLLKIVRSGGEAQDLVEKWKLSAEEAKLLSELSAAKIPLNKASFDRINALIKNIAREPGIKMDYVQLAKVAIKLEQMNLPPTLENFHRISAALNNDFKIADLMSKLAQILENSAPNLTSQIKNFLTNLSTHFEPQAMAKNLPILISVLGLLHEAELKGLLYGGQAPEKMNLKWLLLALLKDFPQVGKELLSSLRDLEAMQLRNLPECRALNGDTFYLQLPVYYQGNWEKMELYFRSEDGNRQHLNKDNVALMINFDTRYLGKLSVLSEIRQGVLNANFYIEDTQALSFVQEHLQELVDNLKNLGYSIGGFSALKMLEGAQLEQFLPPAPSAEESFDIMI